MTTVGTIGERTRAHHAGVADAETSARRAGAGGGERPRAWPTLHARRADNGGTTCTETFVYSGAVQTWPVPAGVTQATFDLYGAAGGDSNCCSVPPFVNPHRAGGQGAHVHAVLNVASGTLDVLVGGRGGTDG